MIWLSWFNATKNLWLIGAAVAIGLGFIAAYKVHEAKKIAAAVEAERAATATAAVAAAKQAADDYRAAEAETPIDADLEYFKALCGKSASCALRSKYAGGAK